MYILYILKSGETGRRYIGITHDIANRIAEHNSGEVKSTKAFRPWKIGYTETFGDKRSARKREIFLKKTAKARKQLFEKIITVPSSSG